MRVDPQANTYARRASQQIQLVSLLLGELTHTDFFGSNVRQISLYYHP